MGAILPPQVAESYASKYLLGRRLERIHQGKVRDTYKFPGREDLLLVVATDRVSIFDFVLPTLIPQKGEVLTALTHFWLTEVLTDVPNHLATSQGLNMVHLLRNDYGGIPLERCLVVHKQKILPFELIFRHHLGGSVYKKYLETEIVAGQQLAVGLPKWTRLHEPLFTPSTKEEATHDVNISVQEFLTAVGDVGPSAALTCSIAYQQAYEYAREKGLLILDTKFEVGVDGEVVIADEVLTPDSSRFTTEEDWLAAMQEGRDPVFYNKQVMRDWGSTVETPWGTGLNNKNLSPSNPEHLAFIYSIQVPEEVITQTRQRYLDVFSRLTDGMTLTEYQSQYMYCT